MASSSCRQVRCPAFGGDLERADGQGGPAAGVLGELFLPGGQALAEQAAALQPDADEQERDREGVGQVLEVVGDVAAVAAGEVEEVHVVDHAEPDIAGHDALGGLVAEFLGVALSWPGRPKNRQSIALNDRLLVDEVRQTCATGIRSCPPVA